MSALETLTELIQQGRGAPEGVLRKAVDALFGERYQRSAGKDAQIRDAYALAREDAEAGIPWAGLINPDNPNSGPYGGTSLGRFPGESTALIGFGVGTRGISPDEGILTRPGHRRRVAALRRLLAKKGVMIWSKADPAALGVSVPKTFSSQFPEFAGTFKRYANEMYCVAQVPSEPKLAEDVVRAFLDLYAFERDWPVLKAYAERVRSQLLRVGQTEIVATELIRIATRLLDALVDVQPKKPRSH